MKKLFFMLMMCLMFMSCKGQETEHFKILDATQYEQKITLKNVTIIDVRTSREYNDGHIKNAQNINVQSSDFEEKMASFDKEKPVYIYCRSGARSGKAGKILEEMGFTEIYDLNGGILSWKGELEQ
ncbi:rhodanese-like domain-containing protein [Flavobacterium sp.]|uniref:rhodanese-like domain-containing protein n=1 Tax=Flavobacterium sp. TaxID=239 RepID=UPI00262EE62F|nr:rhodanese-like domain-containing protein [Flavobacterium sp.]MDD3005561.1 rhodanese-like domain-containing protein [Flavobacterium sp.]